MKVFELAKELDMQSKEIITILNNKGIDVKSHMSVIDDSTAALVKGATGGKSAKSDHTSGNHNTKAEGMTKEDKKAENQAMEKKENSAEQEMKQKDNSKTETEAKGSGTDAPKKKKNIIFVSNPQNSKISGQQGNRQNQNGNVNHKPSQQGGYTQSGYNNIGNRSNMGNQSYRQPQALIRPMIQPSAPESVSAADLRAQRTENNHEKTVKNVENTPVNTSEPVVSVQDTEHVSNKVTSPEIQASPVEKKNVPVDSLSRETPVKETRTDNNVRNTNANTRTQNSGIQGQRTYGDRPQNGNYNGGQRTYGDRPQNGNYNGGQRSYGDRPQNGNNGGQRSYGDRPQNGNYNGGQRTYGDRPQNGNNGGQRSYGDRPQNGNYNGGQRTYGDRPQNGNYNGGQRTYGDRPQNGNNGGQRSYGDRPQNGNYNGGQKTYGDRPQNGNYNGGQRTYGDRPQSGNYNGGQRSYGDRPQGGYNRDGQRPQGGFNRDGQRPAGGGYNRGGFGGGFGQGGFNKDEGNDRPYGKGVADRNKKPASKMFGGDAPMKDAEKHRDDEKRRISQEKDKKNKKDLIYEEETELKVKKAGRFIKPEKKPEDVTVEEIKVITLPESLTIKELADKMHIQASQIVKKLFLQGQIVTVNQEISYETAENIAIEYEIMCEKEVQVDVIEELLKEEEENPEDLTARPPVICVMGHVDHGKTSLLDAIRKTNVTSGEAGGITQAIGAYTVSIKGRSITFLDTPGHEAFTAMRMRGANATDIAILVVAADDGVMPQTIEAINHAKAAGIEIIVAVNKIDRPNSNVEKVKQEMTEYGLVSSDWGGNTTFVPVSAKTGVGIEDLLEMILLTADVMELKANAKRRARGLVIESELDKGCGPVATVLVQKGTLHIGDFISAGSAHGKVRAMIDDKKNNLKEAGPSTPVKILGLNDVPAAGEIFIAHENDKEAKHFAETFIAKNKVKLLDDTKAKMSLDDLFSQIQAGNLKELNLIVKADVQGSVEAVKQSLVKLSNEEVIVKVIHDGVGAINESDVSLASASKAIIIGFNVRMDSVAKATAEREGVDVRLYKVIYQAIEDVEHAMKGMLDPIFEEKIIGHAEVRQIFKAAAIGNIAGSFIMDGMFQRNCKVRITREGKQIFEGQLASLKRFKDDVKEVKAGYECGLVFEDFDEIQELDMVEAYIMVEVPRV